MTLAPSQTYTLNFPTTLPPTGLGFAANAVVIDNFSNQWLFLPDVPKYIAPNSLNVVMQVPQLRQAQARWEAPPGQTQQPAPAGSAQTTWLGVPQATQAGYSISTTTQLQGVADPRTFPPIVQHNRGQITDETTREYLSAQIGRTLYRDDFENATIQWQQASGTVATDNTTCLKGTRSLKLTAAAGAGGQAIARKFVTLAADQFVSTFPLVIVECWFKPFDTNWRDFQLFFRPDDSVQKWQAAVRFWNQQATVSQAQVQYLDSTGTFQNIQQYLVRAAGGSVGDTWHHVMLCLNYKQNTVANGGYLTYALIKFDDLTYKPATPPLAQTQGTASVREGSVDVIVSNDSGAAATVLNLDELLVCDLSNAFQL